MAKRPTTTAAMKLKVLEMCGAKVACGNTNYCGMDTPISEIEYDHFIPLALGGKHEVENLQPLCPTCHSAKTRGKGATTHGSDIGNISKTKRLQAKREGKPEKPKKQIQNQGFQTNRDGKYKQKIGGKTELRE